MFVIRSSIKLVTYLQNSEVDVHCRTFGDTSVVDRLSHSNRLVHTTTVKINGKKAMKAIVNLSGFRSKK